MEPPRAWAGRAALRFVRAGAMLVTSSLAVVIGAGAAPADPLSAPAQLQPKPPHPASKPPIRHPAGAPLIPPAPIGPPPLARAPLPLDLELLPVATGPAAGGAGIAAPAGKPGAGS